MENLENTEVLENEVENQVENTEGEQQEQEKNEVTATQEQEEAIKSSKTFTQEQLNKIVRSRLDRQSKSTFDRYGVKDIGGLDDLINKAHSYDAMKEDVEKYELEIAELKQSLAFLRNGINPEREDDIKAHFKGKEIDLTEENLISELETHPEWRKVIEVDSTPKTTIQTLGVEHRDRNIPETESEKLKRIYGI